MTTESTLRAALQEASAALEAFLKTKSPLHAHYIRAEQARSQAEAALSAHPARASQEQGELSDEQINALRASHAETWTGSIYSDQSFLKFARAVIAADRAIR